MDCGNRMYAIAKEIFPFCRSITGNGVRETHKVLKKYLPEITTYEVPSGTKVFDWTIPNEWNCKGGYIEDESGKKIVDFTDTNLHIMGYSLPVNEWMTWGDLKDHVYTQSDQPDAIPYVTSYYQERWGFCMSEKQKNQLDALGDDKNTML